MDLIKCPYCGEEYSPSYRDCPFCEEEGYSRRAPKRGSRHVSEKKRTHSARGPIIAVLLVVLVVFSWYLFGGKFMEKLNADKDTPVEDSDVRPPVVPDGADEPSVSDPAADDPTVTDPSADDPAVVDPSTDEPELPVVTEPDEPTVDPASLTMKTNVGSLSKAPGTDRYDCSISLADTYIKLIVQGTDAQVTWTSADTSILTIASDGTLKPVKAGTTTATASVGGATLSCIVRIK